MCAPIAGMMAAGGLLENLGDPLGTKKKRDDEKAEQQKSRWAREDAVRDQQYAHEQTLADKQFGGQGGNKTRYSGGTNRNNLTGPTKPGGSSGGGGMGGYK